MLAGTRVMQPLSENQIDLPGVPQPRFQARFERIEVSLSKRRLCTGDPRSLLTVTKMCRTKSLKR